MTCAAQPVVTMLKAIKIILWMTLGALSLAAVEAGYFFYSFAHSSGLPMAEGDWRESGPVLVAPSWSVLLQEQPAHEFLAEYYYRLKIFHDSGRDGELAASIDLPRNTGGRTRLLVYLHQDSSARPTHLEFVDRTWTSFVDLERLSTGEAPQGTLREYLGRFDGEAYPTKFVPANVSREAAGAG